MTTARQLISRALKAGGIIGVGQTASSEDANDAFELMNDMLAEWDAQRWLVYVLHEIAVTSTGAVSYTIGPGATFNTGSGVERPDRLEYAFARQLVNNVPNQVDYKLELIQSREDYSLIVLKQLQSFPWGVFYDSSFPNGTLYFYPVPNANVYAMHVGIKKRLQNFTNLSEDLVMPRIYQSAIYWNLAQRLRPGYGKKEDTQTNRRANATLQALRNANFQIPRLQLRSALLRRGIYNIFSDQNI